MFTNHRTTRKDLYDLLELVVGRTGVPLSLETNMRNRVSVWTAEMKVNQAGLQYHLPQEQLTEYLTVRECYAWLSGVLRGLTPGAWE